MSAPERGLTPPAMLDHERMLSFKGRGRQLASEMLGPYQKAAPNNARSRRNARRAKTVEHDTTSDVVVSNPRRHVGSVVVDERPLGAGRAPKWLKRAPRLSDGVKHEVTHFRIVPVEGPALPGEAWPMTTRVSGSTSEVRSERAERMLREQAYRMSAGNDPSTIRAVHYQEPDAEWRSRWGRLDVTTASTAQVRREASQAFGQVCASCGMNHRGECM